MKYFPTHRRRKTSFRKEEMLKYFFGNRKGNIKPLIYANLMSASFMLILAWRMGA